jgi:hypothetical protein
MIERLFTRRDLLQKSAALGALALGIGGNVACDHKPKEPHCTDESGLTPDEVTARHTLEYVEKTPDLQKYCDNCQQFVAPPAGKACGTCKVVKGPINPKGHCKSWLAKGAPTTAATPG